MSDIYRIKVLSNGYVGTTSLDFTAKIWNVSYDDWTLIRTYSNHNMKVTDLELINSDMVATASDDGTLQIWSISTGLTNKNILVSRPWALKLLGNGLYLACGLYGPRIEIYDINNEILIATLSQHSPTTDLALINDDLLASSCHDSYIYIWDISTNALKFTLVGHTNYVEGLKLISTSILASGSADKTIKLWNVTNGNLIRTLSGHISEIFLSIDTLDSEKLVSGSIDQIIKLWDVSTGELLNSTNTGLYVISLAVLETTGNAS